MAVIKWCQNFPAWLTENRTMFLLVLFIFFWKFSPSVGYIERSYLIDVRQFAPTAFGIILSAGSLTFLVSILAYRWFVKRFRSLDWYHYLYAMVAIGVLSFPLSFFPLSRPQSPLVAVDFVVHSGTCELCAGLEPL